MDALSEQPQSWFYAGREAFAVAAGDPVQRARAAADALTAATPRAAQRQCAAGCTACCHQPVGVRAAEAQAIVLHLQTELSEQAFARVRARVRAAAARADATSWAEQAAQRSACALLGDDARCVAWPMRPIACRGWNAFDRRACDDGRPQVDVAAWSACLGVAEELGAALAASGADGRTYELATALRAALGEAGSAQPVPR
jgi:hypothetical protein